MTSIAQFGVGGGNTVAAKLIELGYNPLCQIETISRYSDLIHSSLVAETTHELDEANRQTDTTEEDGTSATIAAYTWTFDKDGRITGVTSPDGTTDYVYHNNGQLVDADHSYQSDEDNEYDEHDV